VRRPTRRARARGRRRVLTMEWIPGVKLTTLGAPELNALVAVGQEAFLTQLLEVGFIHGDPHPGNLLKARAPARRRSGVGQRSPAAWLLPCAQPAHDSSCADASMKVFKIVGKGLALTGGPAPGPSLLTTGRARTRR
jgi:hypothetical protein